MKRKFNNIAKRLLVEIYLYKTYRSDMGCQVYNIQVALSNGDMFSFSDSYFIGSGQSEKDKILVMFKYELLIKLRLF